jgi:hypothetical protein
VQNNGAAPRRQNSGGFQGARPSGGNSGGGTTTIIKTPISDLRIARSSNGEVKIHVPKESVDEYKEWASINGMTYEKYVQGLVEIGQEQAEGGMLRQGEGVTYK